MAAFEHPIESRTTSGWQAWLSRWAEGPWFFAGWLAVVLVILFRDAVGSDCLFAYRDSAHFYPPLYRLVREEWLAGRVPLWNPLLNNGQPLAGMATSGAFYPPQVLLTLILPDGLSLNVLVILHLAFAATGAYLLARFQGLSRPAATLAGLTYGFGGSVLFQIYNPIYACGAAWLVWGVLGGVRLLAAGGIRDFLLLAAALALSVLCGEPQAAYHAGLVLGLWWLFQPARSWRGLAALVLAAGAGGLLSLVQIALAAEFTAETSRAMDLAPQSIWQVPEFLLRTGQSPDRANWYDILIGRPPQVASHYRSIYAFALQPWRVAELFWLQVAGPHFARWTIPAGIDTPVTWVNTLYCGILPAIAAVAALGRAPDLDRTRPFWIWLLGLSLLASMGAYGCVGMVRQVAACLHGDWAAIGYRPGDEVGGVYWLLSIGAPGYAGFRYPVKWMTVFSLALGQLAGITVAATEHGEMRARLGRLAGITAGAIAIGVAVLGAAAIFRGAAAVLPAVDSAQHGATVWAVVVSGGVHTVVFAALLALICRATVAVPTACLLAALVGSAAVDIATAGRRDLLVGKYSDVVRGGEYVEELKAVRRPELAAVSPRMRIAVTGENKNLVEARDLAAFARFTGLMMRAHVPWLFDCGKFGEVSTAMPADVEALCSSLGAGDETVLPRRTFDLASVDFLLLPLDAEAIAASSAFLRDWSVDQKRGRFEGSAPVGNEQRVVELPLPGGDPSRPLALVVRSESALPRVRVVHGVGAVPLLEKRSWDRWIDALKRIAYPNPEVPDLFHVALVETADPRQPVVARAGSGTSSGRPLADRCRITRDESQRVDVEADLAEPGLVVLADTFHPDWSVVVSSDGGPPRPLPILRTNRIHRGVSLPEGRHVLEFRYRSKTFARTWWITAAAWVAAAAAWVGFGQRGGACSKGMS